MPRPGQLSNQQSLCLSLAGRGLDAKEIADKLFISHKTVQWHLAAARRKYGKRNTQACFVAAILAREIPCVCCDRPEPSLSERRQALESVMQDIREIMERLT